MTTTVLFPYNRKSRSYKDLSKALGSRWKQPSEFQLFIEQHPEYLTSGTSAKRIPLIINWGSANLPNWVKVCAKRVLNPVSAVAVCRNKIKFFDKVKDAARVPDYTTDFETAMNWVRDGKIVMGRSANGSCGTDIVFYEDDPGQFQSSEFWVQYKKKKFEFRVHIVAGEVISLQQKAIRSADAEGQPIPAGTIDFRIRNHRNGFIFKRNEITVPSDVIEQAKLAFRAVPGLDFGAIDVIYNQHEDKAYVLEINTAPGLEGQTLTDYTKAFENV